MGFELLHIRLVEYVRWKLRSGEITERGLARLTGVSQPHLHNVVKGVRIFSAPTADRVMRGLHLDVRMLLGAGRPAVMRSREPLLALEEWLAQEQAQPSGPLQSAGGSEYSGIVTAEAAGRHAADGEYNLQLERLKKLAERIDALVEKDERHLRRAQEMLVLRQAAAAELHAVCAEFAASLNRLTARTELTLDPAEFHPGSYQEGRPNLIQLNARGRIVQIEFEATEELLSSEDFRIPYTLHGAVRGFNQELLQQNVVREQLLFFTVEKSGNMWRFFDARTYRTGPFDPDYLMGVMEELV